MKEHLIIKGMDFIGNQLIEVKLIPDPEYKVKKQTNHNDINYNNFQTVVESYSQIVSQYQEHERIVYISVKEWKKNNYNFASKIVLDLNPFKEE